MTMQDESTSLYGPSAVGDARVMDLTAEQFVWSIPARPIIVGTP